MATMFEDRTFVSFLEVVAWGVFCTIYYVGWIVFSLPDIFWAAAVTVLFRLVATRVKLTTTRVVVGWVSVMLHPLPWRSKMALSGRDPNFGFFLEGVSRLYILATLPIICLSLVHASLRIQAIVVEGTGSDDGKLAPTAHRHPVLWPSDNSYQAKEKSRNPPKSHDFGLPKERTPDHREHVKAGTALDDACRTRWAKERADDWKMNVKSGRSKGSVLGNKTTSPRRETNTASFRTRGMQTESSPTPIQLGHYNERSTGVAQRTLAPEDLRSQVAQTWGVDLYKAIRVYNEVLADILQDKIGPKTQIARITAESGSRIQTPKSAVRKGNRYSQKPSSPNANTKSKSTKMVETYLSGRQIQPLPSFMSETPIENTSTAPIAGKAAGEPPAQERIYTETLLPREGSTDKQSDQRSLEDAIVEMRIKLDKLMTVDDSPNEDNSECGRPLTALQQDQGREVVVRRQSSDDPKASGKSTEIPQKSKKVGKGDSSFRTSLHAVDASLAGASEIIEIEDDDDDMSEAIDDMVQSYPTLRMAIAERAAKDSEPVEVAEKTREAEETEPHTKSQSDSKPDDAESGDVEAETVEVQEVNAQDLKTQGPTAEDKELVHPQADIATEEPESSEKSAHEVLAEVVKPWKVEDGPSDDTSSVTSPLEWEEVPINTSPRPDTVVYGNDGDTAATVVPGRGNLGDTDMDRELELNLSLYSSPPQFEEREEAMTSTPNPFSAKPINPFTDPSGTSFFAQLGRNTSVRPTLLSNPFVAGLGDSSTHGSRNDASSESMEVSDAGKATQQSGLKKAEDNPFLQQTVCPFPRLTTTTAGQVASSASSLPIQNTLHSRPNEFQGPQAEMEVEESAAPDPQDRSVQDVAMALDDIIGPSPSDVAFSPEPAGFGAFEMYLGAEEDIYDASERSYHPSPSGVELIVEYPGMEDIQGTLDNLQEDGTEKPNVEIQVSEAPEAEMEDAPVPDEQQLMALLDDEDDDLLDESRNDEDPPCRSPMPQGQQATTEQEALELTAAYEAQPQSQRVTFQQGSPSGKKQSMVVDKSAEKEEESDDEESEDEQTKARRLEELMEKTNRAADVNREFQEKFEQEMETSSSCDDSMTSEQRHELAQFEAELEKKLEAAFAEGDDSEEQQQSMEMRLPEANFTFRSSAGPGTEIDCSGTGPSFFKGDFSGASVSSNDSKDEEIDLEAIAARPKLLPNSRRLKGHGTGTAPSTPQAQAQESEPQSTSEGKKPKRKLDEQDHREGGGSSSSSSKGLEPGQTYNYAPGPRQTSDDMLETLRRLCDEQDARNEQERLRREDEMDSSDSEEFAPVSLERAAEIASRKRLTPRVGKMSSAATTPLTASVAESSKQGESSIPKSREAEPPVTLSDHLDTPEANLAYEESQMAMDQRSTPSSALPKDEGDSGDKKKVGTKSGGLKQIFRSKPKSSVFMKPTKKSSSNAAGKARASPTPTPSLSATPAKPSGSPSPGGLTIISAAQSARLEQDRLIEQRRLSGQQMLRDAQRMVGNDERTTVASERNKRRLSDNDEETKTGDKNRRKLESESEEEQD